MSGFTAQWLALREAADARARAPSLASLLRDRLAPRSAVTILDLGSGSGSNLRAIAPLLGPDQAWRLVDHDAALLDEAAARLAGWADATVQTGERSGGRFGHDLALRKDGRSIAVAFRRADLADEIAHGDFAGIDLVTASALFDLVSAELIAALAAKVAAAGALFYAVLSYDGAQSWTPPHPLDARMRVAFNRHQSRDKGLGLASGSGAPASLAAAFAATGAAIHVAASPWRLGAGDAALIAELAAGIAAAARETGSISEREIAAWLAAKRESCEIGHQDMLALPR
jgi:SAM-dependent methyltransferase